MKIEELQNANTYPFTVNLRFFVGVDGDEDVTDERLEFFVFETLSELLDNATIAECV